MPIWKVTIVVMLVGAVAACTPKARLPDLQAIYTRAAEASAGQDRRPLIAIPGTLGSRLVDSASGRPIWGGGSAGISAGPDNEDEYRLIALPIPKGDEPLTALRDTVVPAGVLEVASIDILGVALDIDIYGKSIGILRSGGFSVDRANLSSNAEIFDSLPVPDLRAVAATPDPTTALLDTDVDATPFDSFNFDYDWRRDIIESAHKFGRFIVERRAAVAKSRGVRPEEVHFDLLAHSMGGMVSRYFLMYGFADPKPWQPLPEITWAGARYFNRGVFVAPPNGGSIVALDNLVNGKTLGPLQPFYPAPMLSTHVSVYQLMPRPRHNRVLMNGKSVDIYDPKIWQDLGWGLAAPGIDPQLQIMMPDEPSAKRRRDRALAYQARLLGRAKIFHEMMDRWAPPPDHLEMFLVVGGGFETPAAATVGVEGAVRISEVEEGDGVVLRASALLDERQDGDFTTGLRSPLRYRTTLFLPDEHVELTKNPVFGDNLLFWLLEAPRSAIRLAKPGRSELLGGTGGPRRRATPAAAGSPAGTTRQ